MITLSAILTGAAIGLIVAIAAKAMKRSDDDDFTDYPGGYR